MPHQSQVLERWQVTILSVFSLFRMFLEDSCLDIRGIKSWCPNLILNNSEGLFHLQSSLQTWLRASQRLHWGQLLSLPNVVSIHRHQPWEQPLINIVHTNLCLLVCVLRISTCDRVLYISSSFYFCTCRRLFMFLWISPTLLKNLSNLYWHSDIVYSCMIDQISSIQDHRSYVQYLCP